MEQNERLDYLVNALLEASPYRGMRIEKSQKKKMLRALMNIRMPHSASQGFLTIQDAYLRQERMEKGIVLVKDIPTVKEQYGSQNEFADFISIWQGDITALAADAVVNAANSQMLGCFVPCHGCIDNAIHSAAGIQLREECSHRMEQKRIRYGTDYEEPAGQAMLTKGYNLPAAYVIHTVGPVVGRNLNDSLRRDLKNCYLSVLRCAAGHDIKSVAFCCISTGEFHFPNEEAARIAVDTVTDYLKRHSGQFDRIIFNVFKDLDKALYEKYLDCARISENS